MHTYIHAFICHKLLENKMLTTSIFPQQKRRLVITISPEKTNPRSWLILKLTTLLSVNISPKSRVEWTSFKGIWRPSCNSSRLRGLLPLLTLLMTMSLVLLG